MHTQPRGGSGSNRIGLLGSMPGGNVQAPGSSAQPDHSSGDGNRRTSSS